ncbi:MAG: hypothetical protein A2Y38_15365 [Spirochaetes bacterium GWB1_59_5]|nr:MAG: hypothetical protein A2Y38_15365 [Spirochaetes bacterium GWB1_59_5]
MITPYDSITIEISPAVEDYLKAVYRLEQAGLPAQTKRICEELDGIKSASVSAMLKRLADAGLLEYTPYQGVTLTSKGRRISLAVLRKHRILELFLVLEMGYSWEDVHEEAENLEHHASDKLIEKIAAKLGYPEFDPHGDPIPDAQGSLPARETLLLAEAPIGREMRVFRVLDQNPGRLSFYGNNGLAPGSAVTVRSRELENDTINLRVATGHLTLNMHAAARILMVRNN